jgi:hypothetical protein
MAEKLRLIGCVIKSGNNTWSGLISKEVVQNGDQYFVHSVISVLKQIFVILN